MTTVFCLRCGSNRCDVRCWKAGTDIATLGCCDCGHTSKVRGFSFGRGLGLSLHEQCKAICETATDAAVPTWLPEHEQERFRKGLVASIVRAAERAERLEGPEL